MIEIKHFHQLQYICQVTSKMMASSDDERNNSYQTLIPSTRVECQSTFVQHFDEMNNNAHHNHSENQTIRFNSSLPTYGGLVVSNSVEIGSSTHKKSLINRILIILMAVVGLASVFIHLSNTPTHPLPVSKAPLTTKEQTKDPIVRMRSPAPGSSCIPGLFHDPTTQLPPPHLWQLPGRNIKVLQTSISLPPLTLQRAHLLTYPQHPLPPLSFLNATTYTRCRCMLTITSTSPAIIA